MEGQWNRCKYKEIIEKVEVICFVELLWYRAKLKGTYQRCSGEAATCTCSWSCCRICWTRSAWRPASWPNPAGRAYPLSASLESASFRKGWGTSSCYRCYGYSYGVNTIAPRDDARCNWTIRFVNTTSDTTVKKARIDDLDERVWTGVLQGEDGWLL